MSDIVERLRASCNCNFPDNSCMASDECRDAFDAADTIERLQEELREAREVIGDIVDALITYAPEYVHGVPLAKVVARANACLPSPEPFSLVRADQIADSQ